MRRTVSCALWLLVCGILVGVFFALAARRFDLCEPAPQRSLPIASVVGGPTPTPAPRRALITIQVQTDKPDLEIRWTDN